MCSEMLDTNVNRSNLPSCYDDERREARDEIAAPLRAALPLAENLKELSVR